MELFPIAPDAIQQKAFLDHLLQLKDTTKELSGWMERISPHLALCVIKRVRHGISGI
jgi:hypothetical protein